MILHDVYLANDTIRLCLYADGAVKFWFKDAPFFYAKAHLKEPATPEEFTNVMLQLSSSIVMMSPQHRNAPVRPGLEFPWGRMPIVTGGSELGGGKGAPS
jgi:hypothetical protein